MQVFRLAALLKRDSNTYVFLRNLQKFQEHLIWSLRTTGSETCSFAWTALLKLMYSFVCQYSVCCYWHCYNQKQSSGTILQKGCSYKFRQIHKKTPKKRSWHKCFLVNSVKFLITTFFKNSLEDCFCIHARSVYCPTSSPFQKRCHTYLMAAYFFVLICRLRRRVSSII